MLTRFLPCGLVLLFIVRPLAAQQEPPKPPSQSRPVSVPTAEISPPGAPAARGLRDRAEIEAFMDGVMAAQLRENHIAGATVSVVKDGDVFFAKGYGSADVRQQRPVQEPPNDERVCRTMPKAAQEENDEQICERSRSAMPIAPKGNVDVVAEPA